MNKEPIIFITKPEKQLIEKDNLEIEINNYDNSHLYYKGFDLGTFKEIVNLRQEKQELKQQLENTINSYTEEHNLRHNSDLKLDVLKTQQKEFISYLEDEKNRLARECSQIYEDSLGKTRLVSEDIFNEVNDILQKYKSIIGDDK